MKRSLFALLIALVGLQGCAQDVPDLDRTQANRIKKSDLTDGEWYAAQTIVEVPTTEYWSFVGEQGYMDRIRWDVQENYLIAYRTYARIDGGDPEADAVREAQAAYDPNDPNAVPPPEYTGNPVAAFPITSHFDIQRSYDSSTGEQTNVIDENASDRPWYERQYMRVDWSRNLITNYEFINEGYFWYTNLTYFVSEEQGGPDAMVTEVGEDGLEYFDFVSKVHVEPDFWDCLYQWYGWWPGDCTAGEIKIRNSFMRASEVSEYEPVQYDDRAMTKFGFFRTERFGWDPWRSVVQTNRSYLPNRFSIWEEVWQKNEDGSVREDEEGRPLAIPVPERTPKPIVYYVSSTLPEDLWPSAVRVAEDWNAAFRRTVAVAQDKSIDDIGDMFVVCRNPVTEEDADVCGEPGLSPRIGDIRYSTMYWVDRYTQAGLLGYGPNGADPLTGETLFGSAYVYGTEIDNYAQWATDLVRLLNGDLTEEDIAIPDYIRDEIQSRMTGDPSRPAQGRKLGERPAALKDMPVDGPDRMLRPRQKAKMQNVRRHGLEEGRHGRDARVMQLMKEHGLDEMMTNSEIEIMATRGKHGPQNPAPADVRAKIAPSEWASPAHLNARKQKLREAARNNIYLREFADNAIVGLAKSYAGEDDYEKVRAEIRAAVFEAVMLHEVGHTIGLRHNFAGSYDSLNYHEEYWGLRAENLNDAGSLDALYEMATPTQAQIDGRMYEYQYSSIMDYGMRFNSDIQGLGKYDYAAVLFGYSAGTYEDGAGPESGYVEVYSEPGGALDMLKEWEDPPSLAFPVLLEEYHYTTVAQAFDSLDDIQARDTIRYDDLLAQREEDPAAAPPEVGYMFCSDEWAGFVVSCDLFDSGADPFEIALHYIQTYREYYALSHYHRDRIFLWSEDILFSMYARYFSPLTLLYQNWVFAYFYGTSDFTMDDYYLFGAIAGFNLLADTLLTPPSGSYFQDTDGVYYNYWEEEDPEADLFVPRGVGQPLFTDYQWESGYYYFDRTREIGHFWDYLAAMFAITDSETQRLGVDTGADELAYSIPWYLFFEFEILDIMNTIYSRDTKVAGPYIDGGEVIRNPISLLVATEGGTEIYFDPETGREVPDKPATAEQISLDTTVTQELYAALYGMAFFTSNYSQSFPDNFKIFRLGAGEGLQPGPDFEVISFQDPDSGHVYATIAPLGQEWETGASLLIRQGIQWADQYAVATDPEDIDNAYYYLRDTVDRINLLRSLYEIFGWTFY